MLTPMLATAAKLLRGDNVRTGRSDGPMSPSTAVLVLALEMRPCGVDLAKACPEEARRHGIELRDCTDDIRLWMIVAPQELAIPPVEKRHRLFVGTWMPALSSDTRKVASSGSMLPSAKQPWVAAGEKDWYARSARFWEHS